jgi:hypothetical protein
MKFFESSKIDTLRSINDLIKLIDNASVVLIGHYKLDEEMVLYYLHNLLDTCGKKLTDEQGNFSPESYIEARNLLQGTKDIFYGFIEEKGEKVIV